MMPFQEPTKALLTVDNTTTTIRAPGAFLGALRDWLRYPTPQALPEGLVWRPPGGGEAWDGWIRLVRVRDDGHHAVVPTGLLPWVESMATRWGVPLYLDDRRQRPEEGMPASGPIPLRDYQREAANVAYSEGRGVLDMVPRAGKTRVGLEVIRGLAVPFVWVAPTTNIVEQTVRAADELLGRNFALQVSASDALDKGHAHLHVMTAASAAALPAAYFAGRAGLVIDEWHHAAASTYHSIFAKAAPVYFRYGFTGTHFRSGNDALSMHALLSKTLYKVSAEFLLQRGYLTPIRVCMLEMPKEPLELSSKAEWFKVASQGLWKHAFRNDLIAWAADACYRAGRRTLILVGSKEQGRQVLERARSFISGKGHKFHQVELVSTDRPPDQCRKVIDAFVSGTVQVLIGTSMISEGTDLPSSDALIYARGEKAEVTHMQALYRVATAVSGKRDSVIIDFVDHQHPMLLSHSEERIGTYAKTSIARTTWARQYTDLPGFVAR
jgi:superfamily II DNA or RNA helicase